VRRFTGSGEVLMTIKGLPQLDLPKLALKPRCESLRHHRPQKPLNQA